jgi:DNA invertase Pin-like site-specific DNA recombinase
MKKYVAYYRVSTQKQGVSGLGLEAQRECVKGAARDGSLIAEFEEIESGTKNNRKELIKAIDFAKKNKAVLLIAKLDRLSRNATFILSLKNSDVDFKACDMPDANKLTIGLLAVIAENERDLISQRTKAALAAKKARGFKLGTPDNLTDKARKKAVTAIKEKAETNQNNKRAAAFIKALKAQGLSYAVIADQLNENGYKTSTGKEFNPIQAQRLYIKL